MTAEEKKWGARRMAKFSWNKEKAISRKVIYTRTWTLHQLVYLKWGKI